MTIPSFGTPGSANDVNRMHDYDDLDLTVLSHHHTLGIAGNQSSPGDHIHDAKTSKKINYSSLLGAPAIPVASAVLPVDETLLAVVRAIGVSAAYARADHSHGSPPGRNMVHLFSNAANAGAVAATPEVKDVMGDGSFTAISGRKYRFRYFARAQSSVVPGGGDFRVRGNNSAVSPTVASTQLAGASTLNTVVAGGGGGLQLCCEQTRTCPAQLATGLWTVAAFYVWTAGAAGTFNSLQATGQLREFTVDDVT
jgi:hypothetical protein